MATERLQDHCGRSVQLQLVGWPALLPAPPEPSSCVTPAGFLEWFGGGAPPDPHSTPGFRLPLDASNPVLAIGQRAA